MTVKQVDTASIIWAQMTDGMSFKDRMELREKLYNDISLKPDEEVLKELQSIQRDALDLEKDFLAFVKAANKLKKRANAIGIRVNTHFEFSLLQNKDHLKGLPGYPAHYVEKIANIKTEPSATYNFILHPEQEKASCLIRSDGNLFKQKKIK